MPLPASSGGLNLRGTIVNHAAIPRYVAGRWRCVIGVNLGESEINLRQSNSRVQISIPNVLIRGNYPGSRDHLKCFRDAPIIRVFPRDENAIGGGGGGGREEGGLPDRCGSCVSRSLFQDGAVLSHRAGIPARRSNGLARAGRAAEREISAQAEVINHLAAAEAAATQKQKRGSCGHKTHFLELAKEIKKSVPNATISGTVGRQGKFQTEHETYNQNCTSFEVQVNDELVHSKLQTLAFPDFGEVADMIKDVSAGKPVKKIVHQTEDCILL
ncbi:Protein C17orf37 like protein [Cyphomyrmex costatus]|uniref:Protein C17orf37 like protein n=1 Tax=Cyphomyrmex costatus TaxID=456900 RepID=A0A195C380_9HYME|nr:Protein C17orf37 like protein [Cyphomyrmex costatus]